jgi:hypothetical protein
VFQEMISSAAGSCSLKEPSRRLHLGRIVGARKLELRGDIPASHMGLQSTTPLLRNPTEMRHCSQHAGANVDFGDEGAVDWAFLGNLKQLRALLLG